MQNSSLSLLATLCLSTALIVVPAFAEDAPKQVEPTVNAEQVKPQDEAKEQERKMLEAELNNTDVDSAEILDFPTRTSLGEMEMATLPGVKESLITGPASMAPSVSTKDLPSEQLLGRITSEVFQEMADLERGNVFLKLQMQKEQLKNDLEKLKAAYRQSRLEEIAKREDVVRSRINWWQEQENARIEMERKKAETESIEQQIAEAEELRNKLREEAIAEKEAAKRKAQVIEAALNGSSDVSDVSDKADIDEVYEMPRLNTLYALISVRGMKGKLSATVKNLSDGSTRVVKVDDVLPSGHKVTAITRETIESVIDGRKDVLLLMQPVVDTQTNADTNVMEN